MRPIGTPQQLEARRRRAMEMLEKGHPIEEVAERLKTTTTSVKRWQKAYHKKGPDGLKAKPARGRPAWLNAKQKGRLVKILLRGARAAGFPNDLWTCPRVLQVIQQQFGVTYHVDYVGTLLHKLGWSVQKPEQRARERDEAAIARWRQVEWPRIKKGARAES
jgi:transposase